MRLDRLLAMTMILINRQRVRAQELAEMFDVSVRTIYRDIDTITQAGIPVVTYQGANGGIGLIEGYRLDKHVLTKDELASITMALKSVSTSYQDAHATAVLEKIQGISKQHDQVKESIFIDFSPWGQQPHLQTKVTMLKKAVESCTHCTFHYFDRLGQSSQRTVEPHLVILKGRSWYLYSYCLQKKQFRLFKLARMQDLQIAETTFQRKQITIEDLPWDKEWYNQSKTIAFTLAFHNKVRTIVEEYFHVENITVDEKGRLIIETEMPEDEWLYGFILSFRDDVEVLHPESLRVKIKKLAGNVAALYRSNI